MKEWKGCPNFVFMIRLLIVTILFATLSAFGPGDVRWMSISGQVIDQETGQALIGAKVYLTEADKAVYTDPDGYFELVAPIEDDTHLIVEYVSYQDKSLTAHEFTSGSVIVLSER